MFSGLQANKCEPESYFMRECVCVCVYVCGTPGKCEGGNLGGVIMCYFEIPFDSSLIILQSVLAFALQKNICLGLNPGDAIVLSGVCMCLACMRVCVWCVRVSCVCRVCVHLALSKMPQSLRFSASTFLISTASPLLFPPFLL